MMLLNCLYKNGDPTANGEGKLEKIEYARQKMDLENHVTNPQYFAARKLIGKLSYLEYLQGSGFLTVEKAKNIMEIGKPQTSRYFPSKIIDNSTNSSRSLSHKRQISQPVKRPLAEATKSQSVKRLGMRNNSKYNDSDNLPFVGNIVEKHFEMVSKSRGLAKGAQTWGADNDRGNVWTFYKGGRKREIKSVTNTNFWPNVFFIKNKFGVKAKNEMIDVKVIKKIYDELSLNKYEAKTARNNEISQYLDQIKVVYENYMKLNEEKSFIGFMQYMYPGLSKYDINKIKASAI